MGKFSKIPLSREGGALAKYLEELGDHHPLASKEEVALSKRIQAGDEEARNKLVKANLRFVVSVAKNYQGHGMPLGDLINEGNFGLIKAADRFDGERGFKFISYAVWWIRQSILSALAEQARVVRLPLNRVGELYKISKVATALEQEMGAPASIEQIAEEIGMLPKEVAEALRNGKRHRSLDAPFGPNKDENSLFDLISDEGQVMPDGYVTDNSSRDEVGSVLDTLPKTEAEILRLYFGIGREETLTLEEIGERYGLTRERIRQIKEKALRRLRHVTRMRRLRNLR